LSHGLSRILDLLVSIQNTVMPPATQAQKDTYKSVSAVSAYRPKRPDGPEELELVLVDDIPEVDAEGRRRGEGFKASWEGVVDESKLLRSVAIGWLSWTVGAGASGK
jgi:hypothetical protein